MSDRRSATPPVQDDGVDTEGGKAAAGERDGSRGQLDGASGGYGTNSGRGTSGGTGDGDAATDGADSEPTMDDGSTSGSGTGASGSGPTEWLRSESTNPKG